MQFLKNLWKMRENKEDVKLVTTERKRNNLESEPNYHNTKFFTENLLAIEMENPYIFKPVKLGLPILELNIILLYELWCDYAKPKFDEKAKLCYMDTYSFIVYTKADDDIYKDIAKDVETRHDT